jgi:hypothetical protein
MDAVAGARKERQASLHAASTALKRYAEQNYTHLRKQYGGGPAESYKRKLRECLIHLSAAPSWTEPLEKITPEQITEWKNDNNLAPTLPCTTGGTATRREASHGIGTRETIHGNVKSSRTWPHGSCLNNAHAPS